MERIIDKRLRIYDSKQMAQYLLHWQDYKSKHNEWQSITKLENFMELVEEYKTKTKKASSTRANKALALSTTFKKAPRRTM